MTIAGATERPAIGELIRESCPARAVSGLPEILLHLARFDSGLTKMVELAGGRTPYWAYAWGGGLALARHVLGAPETVRDKRVLDLGAGSGLVGIAAAKAGAASVTISEADPVGRIAARLNADLNGARFDAVMGDIASAPTPDVDLVLAGDVFYSAGQVRRLTPFFDRCADAGIEILIGDPFRKTLPLKRLELLSSGFAEDFGGGSAEIPVGVFAWRREGETRAR